MIRESVVEMIFYHRAEEGMIDQAHLFRVIFGVSVCILKYGNRT